MVHSKRVSLFLLGITVALLGLFILFRYFTNEQKLKNQILLVYENEIVVLKQGNEVLERFDEIDFDNLPARDRVRLKNGIEFSTKEEALVQIEDYDG